MRIIIGLGNPGIQYVATRHNAGILLVDKLAESLSSDYGWRKFYGIMVYKTPDVILIKSADYFMNESGNVVRDVQRMDELKNAPYDLYLAHDDLDIKLGEFKIQQGKGPKAHNGIDSVEQALGSKDFWRIRIGIENRTQPIAGEDYVLQKFSSEELTQLNEVLERTINAIPQAAN